MESTPEHEDRERNTDRDKHIHTDTHTYIHQPNLVTGVDGTLREVVTQLFGARDGDRAPVGQRTARGEATCFGTWELQERTRRRREQKMLQNDFQSMSKTENRR